MPELVEVENYRRLLLPLCSNTTPLSVECSSPTPPKVFLTEDNVASLKQSCVRDVERKGKLLRLVLEQHHMDENTQGDDLNKNSFEYLYLHMGMTGRISNPDTIPSLESLSRTDSYPPPHTHLILKLKKENSDYEVAFSDPRRFGGVCMGQGSTLDKQWHELAMDAMNPISKSCLKALVGQSRRGVKALLLDQRAIVSGVGNWIADEILYQSEIHPDQTNLTEEEVHRLEDRLEHVLCTANECLKCGVEYPLDWIFQIRWSKSKTNNGKNLSDSKGRKVIFLKSGGRTSAIVPSIQKLRSTSKRTTKAKFKEEKSRATKRNIEVESNKDSNAEIGKKRRRIKKEEKGMEPNTKNVTNESKRRFSRRIASAHSRNK